MNHDTYHRGPLNHHDGLITIRDSRRAYHTRCEFDDHNHKDRFWSIIATVIFMMILMAFIYLSVNVAFAQSPRIYDRQTGKYLGNLNNNTLDPNSVSNPLGRYGNPLSPDSINNTLGEYGSPLSNKSVRNPLATQSPVLVDPSSSGWTWD